MDTAKSESQALNEAVNRGREVTVRYIGGAQPPEKIIVRTMTIRQCKALLANLADPATLAELFCGKKTGEWADTVEVESIDEIVSVGLEVNRPTLTRYAEMQSKLAGWGIEVVKPIMDQIAKVASTAKLPFLPPSAPGQL